MAITHFLKNEETNFIAQATDHVAMRKSAVEAKLSTG
jgi:hypothetical protein